MRSEDFVAACTALRPGFFSDEVMFLTIVSAILFTIAVFGFGYNLGHRDSTKAIS